MPDSRAPAPSTDLEKRDYSRYLVLYSGGVDSTWFISQEPTARHLIHYRGANETESRIALVNASTLGRFLTVRAGVSYPPGPWRERTGETNEINALYDTEMAIAAGIEAVSFGMKGIVMCFNADDLCIETEAVTKIFRRVEPEFEVLLPLRDTSAAQIRKWWKAAGRKDLQVVSCQFGQDCGFCPKCVRGY